MLSGTQIKRLEQAYEFSMAHPGPGMKNMYPEAGTTFYADFANLENWPYYQKVLRGQPFAESCRTLWDIEDDGEVFFMNEQVWLKEGGPARRTPWHQDASYTPYEGQQLAIFWVNFDPVPKEYSLEFVRGSHLGTLYNGSSYNAADDTEPAFAGSDLPRLPPIESERDRWDIVSFELEPGDVVAFHNRILHGGGGTPPCGRRRTLSLRFFGSDVVRVGARSEEGAGESGQLGEKFLTGYGALVRSLEPGQALSKRPEFFRL
jgi:ectoine hydroxylase-related dioxygenase (phytanoyl-CoA dioxygenase family)